MAKQIPKRSVAVGPLQSHDMDADATEREVQVVPAGKRVWVSHLVIHVLNTSGVNTLETDVKTGTVGSAVAAMELRIAPGAFDRHLGCRIDCGFELNNGLVWRLRYVNPSSIFYKVLG